MLAFLACPFNPDCASPLAHLWLLLPCPLQPQLRINIRPQSPCPLHVAHDCVQLLLLWPSVSELAIADSMCFSRKGAWHKHYLRNQQARAEARSPSAMLSTMQGAGGSSFGGGAGGFLSSHSGLGSNMLEHSSPFRTNTRRHTNRWSGAYNNFGDVPNSVLKCVLEHIDSVTFNSRATAAWHWVVTWAHLVVGVGLFPDSPFQFRSDQQRDVETLKAEYRRRSLLAGNAFMSGETPHAVMEKALELLQQRADGMVQYQIMKCELQGVIRQYVSNGSSARWLETPSPPATEWVTHKDPASGRFYTTDNTSSVWLDEFLPAEVFRLALSDIPRNNRVGQASTRHKFF